MSKQTLPLGIIDMITTRLNSSHNMMRSSRPTRFAASMSKSAPPVARVERFMHTAAALAVKEAPVDGYRVQSRRRVPLPMSPRRRTDSVSPFSRSPKVVLDFKARVDALVNEPLSRYEITDTPALEEEDLLNIYEDLLAHPTPKQRPVVEGPSEHALVDRAWQRLLSEGVNAGDTTNSDAEGHSLVAYLRSRRPNSSVRSIGDGPTAKIPISAERYVQVLSYVERVVRDLEGLSTQSEKGEHCAINIGILSEAEWEALIVSSVEAEDEHSAEHALDLMQTLGIAPSEASINGVLNMHARTGDVAKAEALLAKFAPKPTPRQRDLHIKAHLRSPSTVYGVSTALSAIHKYESLALPAPIPSYTRVISTLLSSETAEAHAHAWDLFAHMRYVAHPTPDILLYSLMIRACGGVGPSQHSFAAQPERALDLWTEMTVDHRMEPTLGAYNAIITACARSKSSVSDAFRLAKEMLDSQRDAYGRPLLVPDTDTFCALLMGAKKIGDLGRVRWILAEMVRHSNPDDGRNALINEEAMIHVFHAYASYQIPSKSVPVTIDDPTSLEAPKNAEETTAVENVADDRDIFTVTPPQTAQQVLAEAHALFNRIQNIEQTHPHLDARGEVGYNAFSSVVVSTRLVNSYLSVCYRYAPLDEVKSLYSATFEKAGVQRNHSSIVDALKRCAYPHKLDGPMLLKEFGDSVWAEWNQFIVHEPMHARTARLIEQAYSSRIRMLAHARDADSALAVVQQFCTSYPAENIKQKPATKLDNSMRSPRVVLFADKPLVRVTPSTQIPDYSVPPFLTFRDVELLHHRLVERGRMKDLRYLKWVCKSYDGALKVRREKTMKA